MPKINQLDRILLTLLSKTNGVKDLITRQTNNPIFIKFIIQSFFNAKCLFKTQCCPRCFKTILILSFNSQDVEGFLVEQRFQKISKANKKRAVSGHHKLFGHTPNSYIPVILGNNPRNEPRIHSFLKCKITTTQTSGDKACHSICLKYDN